MEKRARLVNEINTPLIQGKGTSVPPGAMLMDLDDNERSRRLDDITQVSMSYLTEQLDDMVRKNILLRLWTGCIDAAKAIRFKDKDEWLKSLEQLHAMGYEYKNQSDLNKTRRDYREVLLYDRLEAAIRKLNPELDNKGIPEYDKTWTVKER